jgi:hypothetical protein
MGALGFTCLKLSQADHQVELFTAIFTSEFVYGHGVLHSGFRVPERLSTVGWKIKTL